MTSLVDNEKKKNLPERNSEGLLDCSTCDQKTHPSFFENEEQCCDCSFGKDEKKVNFNLGNNEELLFNKNDPVSKIPELKEKKKNLEDKKRRDSLLKKAGLMDAVNRVKELFPKTAYDSEDDSEDEYENNEQEKNSENKAFVDVMINMQKMMKAQQEQMDNMNKLMQKFLESKKDI